MLCGGKKRQKQSRDKKLCGKKEGASEGLMTVYRTAQCLESWDSQILRIQ